MTDLDSLFMWKWKSIVMIQMTSMVEYSLSWLAINFRMTLSTPPPVLSSSMYPAEQVTSLSVMLAGIQT